MRTVGSYSTSGREKKIKKREWRLWSHRQRPKMLHAIVAVPATPVRVPSQRPSAPSVTSVTSVVNDKGDNEMIPGAAHRSLSICLTTEENPGKPQLGDLLMKRLCDQSSPQMGSLSSKWCLQDCTARLKGRRKEGLIWLRIRYRDSSSRYVLFNWYIWGRLNTETWAENLARMGKDRNNLKIWTAWNSWARVVGKYLNGY